MKTKLLEKNGFPRPIGLVLIIIVLSLFCFSQYLLAQSSVKENQKANFPTMIPAVIVVHTGFKFPPRMVVNPIESPLHIEDWVAELKYWNNDRYDDLAVLLAKREKQLSESEKINKIVASVTAVDDEIAVPKRNTKRTSPILQSIGKSGIQRDR
jgi:hypothetical protein